MLFVLLWVSLGSALQFKLQTLKTPLMLLSDSNSSLPEHLTNYYNTQYYIVLDVGTPAKPFTALIDTGSSYFWLPSVNCSNCHSIAHHYNYTLSSSYQPLNKSIVLKYKDGSVKGTLGQETVTVNSMTVNNLLFAVVTEEENMNLLGSDGILGLAFSNKLGGYLNLVDSLKGQGLIERSIFSIYLNDNIYGDMTETDPESNIIFGDFDLSYATEAQLKYVRIYKDSGFWFSSLTSIAYKGTNLSIASKYTIFHTGSYMIQGPYDDISLMMKMIKGDSYCYNVNNLNFCVCKDYKSYPVFNFTIDGQVFELGPESYLTQVAGWCAIMLEVLDNSNAIVLALPFFRKYYSVFDLDNARVGLALAKKSVIIQNSQSGASQFGIFTGLGIVLGIALMKYYNSKKNQGIDYLPIRT